MAKSYTEEERENALTMMVVNHGSRDKASKITGIPRDTLSDWAYHSHRDKYRELRQKFGKMAAEAAVETMYRRAEEYGQAADVVKDKLMERDEEGNYTTLAKLDPREMSNTFRNLMTGAGINLTNAANHLKALDDQPSVNINLSLTDLIRSFGGKVYDSPSGGEEIDPKAIEGTAEEVSHTPQTPQEGS